MGKGIGVALLLAVIGTAHGQPTTPAAQAVLDANHAAVGDLPVAGALELAYSHTSDGLTGPEVVRYDLASGAYVESQDASGIHNGDGFDGKTPWQQDISLAYTPQLGGDRLRTAVDAAYQLANLWWRRDHGGARIRYVGREIVDGRSVDRLSIAPKGGKPFDACFDAETHFLAKVTYDQQFFHITKIYSDYRPEAGLMLAHKIVSDPGLGDEAIGTSILVAASLGPARPLSDYASPAVRPTGASIVGDAVRSTVPFRLLNNHIYLQAMVDGKGPYTFMVDTGGHTLLSPRLIGEVGLPTVGESVTSGAGEGHSTAGFVHFDEIAIGDVRLKDQIGFATEIYDQTIEGIQVDGMVGFELIRRMVTTIDYGNLTVTFTDPTKFKPDPALGVAVPFVFYDHMPYLVGSVAGLPAHFQIDTGSRSQIDLTSPFVKTHDLRSRFTRGTSAVVGWGVGGPSRSFEVRMPDLKLGSVPVAGVVAGLAEDNGGSMSDPNYDGNVGSGLLKRFVVTFDYPHQVMYLKRINPTPPDVGTFDRSGLWINAEDGGFEVADVAKESAGALAGLAVGDVITAIDGAPVETEKLAEARLLLRDRPAGSRVALSVRRGSETRTVSLILRDQI